MGANSERTGGTRRRIGGRWRSSGLFQLPLNGSARNALGTMSVSPKEEKAPAPVSPNHFVAFATGALMSIPTADNLARVEKARAVFDARKERA